MKALLERLPEQWRAITALSGAVGMGVSLGAAATIWAFTLGSVPQRVSANAAYITANTQATQANTRAIQVLARSDSTIVSRLDQLICIQLVERVELAMQCL